jgi:hypothetical protein
MRTLALLVVVTVGLASFGCDTPANTQKLPVGSRCTQPSQCGSSPYGCSIKGYPGGYCDKDCATDGDCPADSVCAAALRKCRRKCVAASECRESEGYTCRAFGATTTVCELPTIPPDLGGSD